MSQIARQMATAISVAAANSQLSLPMHCRNHVLQSNMLGLSAAMYCLIMPYTCLPHTWAQSTVSSMRTVPASSGNMHGYSRKAVLEVLLPRRVAAVALQGFIFFGNSISISSRIDKVGR